MLVASSLAGATELGSLATLVVSGGVTLTVGGVTASVGTPAGSVLTGADASTGGGTTGSTVEGCGTAVDFLPKSPNNAISFSLLNNYMQYYTPLKAFYKAYGPVSISRHDKMLKPPVIGKLGGGAYSKL